MNDDELLVEVRARGVDPTPSAESWRGAHRLLSALDAVARTGLSVVVKVDGSRGGEAAYTVVVSGLSLGDHFFRRDGASLESLVREALHFVLAESGGRRK